MNASSTRAEGADDAGCVAYSDLDMGFFHDAGAGKCFTAFDENAKHGLDVTKNLL